ncbi:hypothetical protein NY78_1553 [Desulfovibrio sp. TomC]|nr:hypothetical protein NY78_1553 [Desulfovibrio sp. TomC]
MPERLRVWQMAGVRHFYIDPDAAFSDASPAQEPAVPEEPDRAMGLPSAVDMPPQEATAQVAATTLSAAVDAAAATLTEAALSVAPAAPSPSLPEDPSQWPDPWPALYAKAPARPRLVITYSELGFDLTGQADPRRGGLWRTLLRDLDLAGKNAVAFWPFALPTHTLLTDFPEHFAAGIRRMAPAVLAVFGPLPPAVALALDQIGQPMPVIERLPHPETLLASDPEAWNHVCTTLSPFA